MGSLFSIKSAALEAPCTIEQVSWWQKGVANAQTFPPYSSYNYNYNYRGIPTAISFGMDQMPYAPSHERLSVDGIEQEGRPRSSSSQSGNLSSPRLSHATTAQTTLPPEDSSRITIRVFSHKVNDFVDLPATIDPDENCTKNWISQDLVDSLGLKSFKRFGDDEIVSGTLENGMMFPFEGTVQLGWTWRDPPPLCGRAEAADCHVVPNYAGNSMIRLKASLCSVSDIDSTMRSASPIVAPVPQPENSFGAQLEKIASISGGSNNSVDGSRSGSEKDGVIDEGDMFDDNTNEAQWADEWINSFTANIEKRFKNERKGAMGRVKIAILDTGVDHNHIFIDGAKTSEILKESCCFVGSSKDATDDSRTQDNDGHGTHIAGLVMKLAPCAEIYVAKVSEKRLVPVRSRIADAVRWAVQKNVDIISMSFGFRSWVGHEGIRTALEDACSSSKNILLFAAASNKGKHFEPTFPASEDSVICIYATDGHGYRSRLNPQIHNRKTRFATLGHGVKSIKAGTKAGEVRGTGTSYATPIAAAIAANILELALRTDMENKFFNMLKSRHGMEKVFLTMAPKDDVNDLDCVDLSNLFHKHMRDASIHDTILKTLDP